MMTVFRGWRQKSINTFDFRHLNTRHQHRCNYIYRIESPYLRLGYFMGYENSGSNENVCLCLNFGALWISFFKARNLTNKTQILVWMADCNQLFKYAHHLFCITSWNSMIDNIFSLDFFNRNCWSALRWLLFIVDLLFHARDIWGSFWIYCWAIGNLCFEFKKTINNKMLLESKHRFGLLKFLKNISFRLII